MNDKVTIQLIFTTKLSKKCAKELLSANKRNKTFKCYKRTDKIPYGEFIIQPEKGFTIRVKVKDKQITREVLEELKNGKD